MTSCNRAFASTVLVIAMLATGCFSRDKAGGDSTDVDTSSKVKLAQEGPQPDELASALLAHVREKVSPALQIKSFDIEGQESLGSQIEPAYGVRFHGGAVLSEDLFSESFRVDDRIFTTVASQSGTRFDLYGKIISERYQNTWTHEVDLEGQPFVGLKGETRQTLESEKKATVIPIGTDAEKQQLKQWRSEGKMTTRDDVEGLLVGTWDGECTKSGGEKPDWLVFTSFEPGGVYREGFVRVGAWGANYEMESARKRKSVGTWAVFGGGIVDRTSNYNGGNRNVERIVTIEQDTYTSESGGLKCIWTRVDLANQAREAQQALERQKSERIAEEQARVDRRKRNDALIQAATKGDARLVQELISEGVDLDTRDYNNRTSLMLAARYGHADVLQLLLAAGADPNYRNQWGTTALGWAKREKQAETVRILTEAGAKE